MQLYEVSPTAGVPSTWFGTRGEAHDNAKLKGARGDVRIYLWDVPTDKANVVAALNGGKPWRDVDTVLQGWGLTARGGLQEIDIAKVKRDLADEIEGDVKVVGPTEDELADL